MYGTLLHVRNGSWHFLWIISLQAHSHSSRWVSFINFTEQDTEALRCQGLGKRHTSRSSRAINRIAGASNQLTGRWLLAKHLPRWGAHISS